MSLRLAALFMALVAAHPLLAQDDSAPPEAAVAFALALRDAGCASDDAGALSAATGLDDGALQAAALALAVEGLVIADAPSLRLIPALCDPEGHGDMTETVVAIMRLNGCAMTGPGAAEFVARLGMTEDMTGAAANALIDSGGMVLTDDGGALSDELCDGTGTILPSLRGQALTALRDLGCQAGPRDLIGALTGGGLAPEMAAAVVERLLGDGSLTETAEGDVVLAGCRPAVPGAPMFDPVERLVAALRMQGCAAPSEAIEAAVETFEELLPEAVLEQAEARFEALIAIGDISERGDRILLSEELCAGGAGALATAEAAFLATLRAAGCAMATDSAIGVTTAQGTPMADVDVVLNYLAEIGQISFRDGNVNLAAALCDAAPVALPRPEPAPEPGPTPQGDPAALALIAAETAESAAFRVDGIMRLNGCTVPLNTWDAVDSRLSAPLAVLLGLGFGSDPAVDTALRDLAIRGVGHLRSTGKLEWDAQSGMARLIACP